MLISPPPPPPFPSHTFSFNTTVPFTGLFSAPPLACLLYFKSPVFLCFPYRVSWASSFPSPSATLLLLTPTLFLSIHSILFSILLSQLLPSLSSCLFFKFFSCFFHNWQTCTGNIPEKYHSELFPGSPRTTVCFHPTVGLWTGPISFGLMGAVWILTGTICLPQSWFLRDVQRKLMTCWYPTAYLLSSSHMHYKITCGKKKLKVMYNINRFSVTSYTKGIQYVNCQAFLTQETSAEILLAGA